MKNKFLKINPYVFFPSAILITIFLAVGTYFTSAKSKVTDLATNGKVTDLVAKSEVVDPLTKVLGNLQTFLTVKFGWFYLLTAAFILIFILWIMFSKHGKIKLGKDTDEPEFSRFTWFAMLFSAGIGIGLLFYGVAEPIDIFSKPTSADIVPESANAAIEAMNYTFFHWGFHAWAIYILVGLSLAYFSYRHNLPLTLRSALFPILGKRINGRWGDAVEVFAVISTLFGVATSLGLGATQVNTGLSYLNMMSSNTNNQIILIIGITLIATFSVITGVNKGIRRLSEANLILALILLLFVFFAGPTAFLLKAFTQNVGNYLQNIVGMTFKTDIYNNNQYSTSTFYLAWWIAWSPFVGMFIARISKGRTIREFILCVLIVPVLLTFLWMTVFGNTAIFMELHGSGGIVAAYKHEVSTALFVMLEKLPIPTISCGLAIIVLVFFFVTSSDSASLVIDIMTSGGRKNPPVWQKIFWAFAEGLVAIVLLITGGLAAMKSALLITALPFAIVLFFICYSLWKALRTDTALKEAKGATENSNVLLNRNFISVPGIQPVDTAISEHFQIEEEDVFPESDVLEHISEISADDNNFRNDWKKRLKKLESANYNDYFTEQFENVEDKHIDKANEKLIDFINKIVKPAFLEIKQELVSYDRTVKLNISKHQASIIVMKGDIEELCYGIRGKVYHKLSYTFPAFDTTNTEIECYGQIFLRGESKTLHELKKFTKSNIIHDFINEYEKWAILN